MYIELNEVNLIKYESESVKNPMVLTDVEHEEIFKVKDIKDVRRLIEKKDLLFRYGVHLSKVNDELIILLHKHSNYSVNQRKHLIKNIHNDSFVEKYDALNNYANIRFTNIHGVDLDENLVFNIRDLYDNTAWSFLKLVYSLKEVKDIDRKYPVYEIISSEGSKELVHIFINNIVVDHDTKLIIQE